MAQAVADPSKRTWLKAADVCERAQVQAYVLRTWEMEFADLGVVKNPGGPRLYRPADLERVLRIKQLVFVEGLTLAGARRKLDEERQPTDELPFDDEPQKPRRAALDADARKRMTTVRNGLRALLTLLSQPRAHSRLATAATPVVVADDAAAPANASRKTATKRRKAAS
jgi:DNA-binding transcriptional MerR regulator